MSIDTSTVSKTNISSMLTRHIPEKLTNRRWLLACLKGNYNQFPYIHKEKEASVANGIFQPKNQPISNPLTKKSQNPFYLVNVPFQHRPQEQGYQSISRLLNLYKNESFGLTATESRNEIKNRFSLVIGVNQIQSLDQEINLKFEDWISEIPKIEGIAYRIIGFLWQPNWIKTPEAPILTYNPMIAFTLLKQFSKEAALQIRTSLEGTTEKLNEKITSQVPMQKIREKIKQSDQTNNFIDKIIQNNPQAPIYFGIMDSDAIQFRQNSGLFTRYDQTILTHKNPSAFTHGYSVLEPNRPLITLGVRLDMICRAAMNSVFSYGAYFPEPGSFFRVKEKDGISILSQLSFIGNGQSLESRRLIENGLRVNVLYLDSVFISDGGVTTTTPTRMITKKNSGVPVLTIKNLKSKTNLKALRGISQTHITPKQWADNLYLALHFSVPQVTDATGPMMHLFNVYDPLSRIFDIPGRYKPTNVDQTLQNYFQPLSNEQAASRIEARANLHHLGMDLNLVDYIERAAQVSGIAIAQELARVLGIQIQ